MRVSAFQPAQVIIDVHRAKRRYTRMRADARFWDKVLLPADGDGCFEWIGARKHSRRGQLHMGHKNFCAQRASWLFAHGSCPYDMFVLNRCGNFGCVRPDHLYLTQSCRGNRPLKLSPEQVRAIRSAELSHRLLAERYGVSKTTITMIRLCKAYEEVSEP